jgi:AcrR family transcriptional regulator
MKADGVSQLETRRQAADKAAGGRYTKRREEVMEAAASLVATKGYAATTFADIADAVGVDRATLYYYFKSKTEITRAAIGGTMERSLAELQRIMALEEPAAEKVRLFIRRLVAAFEEAYPYGSLYFQGDIWRSPDLDAEWVKAIRSQDAQIDNGIVRIIEDGQRDGSIRADLAADLIAKTVFGSVYAAHRWLGPRGTHRAADAMAAFDALLVPGLAPPVS